MSPVKQSYVEAINAMFKLGSNVFIRATVETILEKIEVDDYEEVLLYLAKRKSDYETPLEKLAKGIDEFYADKKQKAIEYARERSATLALIVGYQGLLHSADNLKKGMVFEFTTGERFVITEQDIGAIKKLKDIYTSELDSEDIKKILYEYIEKDSTKKYSEDLLLEQR